MSKMVLADPHLTINAVDLSAYVKQITINYQADVQERTASGDTTRTRLGGLLDWSLDVEFLQDYDAAKVDATLFPLVGTSFAIIVRAKAAAKSATNPEFTGNGILESYAPLAGSIGDTLMAPVTIVADGTLTRATS